MKEFRQCRYDGFVFVAWYACVRACACLSVCVVHVPPFGRAWQTLAAAKRPGPDGIITKTEFRADILYTADMDAVLTVSYTHLTLPTIYSV